MLASPSSSVLCAGVAVTLQLIRWSIDLVVIASIATKPKEDDQATKEKSKKATNKKSVSGVFFALPKSYGSLPTTDQKYDNDEEEQPLLQHVPPTWMEKHMAAISLVVHVILFISLLTSLFLADDDVDGAMIRTASLAIFLSGLLAWRDYDRKRFGISQRFFLVLGSLILWGASVAVWTLRPQEAHSGTELVLLFVCSIHLALSFSESRIVRYPATATSSTGKPVLSRHAIITLLRPYFWPDATSTSAALNRIRAILTWVCVISSKVANLFSPILLGWATTALSRQDYYSCIKYSILYSILGFLGSTFKEGQSLIYLKVAQAAFVQLSEVAFHHIHSLSLDWHLRKKLGEVIRSMDRGIAACDTLMKYLFLWLVPALVECLVVCIIFATYFDYLPMAIAVFYFVFAYILWTILVTLWRKKFRKAVVKSDNEWHDLCTDSLINFETVKFFTAEDYEMKRFGDAVKRYQSGSVDVQASLSFLNISQKLLLQACLATALSMATLGVKDRIDCCLANGCDSGISQCCIGCSGMEVGDFVAVLTFTFNLFAPLNYLGSVYNSIVMAVIDLTNLSELLAESPDVTDAPDAIELPSTNAADPDVAVEFDNVYFHYPTQPERKGLKGISFRMKRGTTTAIVGSTGGGKTTISRLFFRFYDVMGGAVKVNGVDIRSVKQTSLRGAIGVVPQVASMFNDTLRANILYGRRDATQADLDKAADDAQLTSFIHSLDAGWDTMVGDRGLKLSGGEKQRAAIARCLLKDPPFVILDEATSALDTLTEHSVQQALDSLGKERTVLVIAHRLGTVRNADNIIVLKDGGVAEEGTHDDLLARDGLYAEMWGMQLSSAQDSREGLESFK